MGGKKEKKENESSDESADEKEWPVEKIVDKRVVKGKVEYKVKWEGWDPSWNSWEPMEHLNCTDIIDEFEEKLKKKQTASAKTDSSKRKMKFTVKCGGIAKVDPVKSKKSTDEEPAKADKPKESSVKTSSDVTPLTENRKRSKSAEPKRKEEPSTSGVVAKKEKPSSENNESAAKRKKSEDTVAEKTPVTESKRKSAEASVKRKKSEDQARKGEKKSDKKKTEAKPETDELQGFDRGLEVEKIVGANDDNQELQFCIKWVDHPETEFVPARIANVKCPQAVIDFYEERLTWHSPKTSN